MSSLDSFIVYNVKPLCREIVEFLIPHQYLESGFSDLAYSSATGPGQGLTHSAAVANMSFVSSMELSGPRLASEETWKRLGIIQDIRFADNLLFVWRLPIAWTKC